MQGSRIGMTAKTGSCYKKNLKSGEHHYYKETQHGTVDQCRALCDGDAKCKWFTYEQTSPQRCWLMDFTDYIGLEAHWKCFKKTATSVESSVGEPIAAKSIESVLDDSTFESLHDDLSILY